MEKMPDRDRRGVAVLAADNMAVTRYLGDLLHQMGLDVYPPEGHPSFLLRYDQGALYLEHDGLSTAVDVPLRASRLAAIIKRALQAGVSQQLSIGPYKLLPQEYLLVDESGQGTRLTEKETAILTCLHGKGGVAISRQALLDEVWSYAQGVETHTLETHIYRLRQKIEQDPSEPRLLITTEEGYALAL